MQWLSISLILKKRSRICLFISTVKCSKSTFKNMRWRKRMTVTILMISHSQSRTWTMSWQNYNPIYLYSTKCLNEVTHTSCSSTFSNISKTIQHNQVKVRSTLHNHRQVLQTQWSKHLMKSRLKAMILFKSQEYRMIKLFLCAIWYTNQTKSWSRCSIALSPV